MAEQKLHFKRSPALKLAQLRICINLKLGFLDCRPCHAQPEISMKPTSYNDLGDFGAPVGPTGAVRRRRRLFKSRIGGVASARKFVGQRVRPAGVNINGALTRRCDLEAKIQGGSWQANLNAFRPLSYSGAPYSHAETSFLFIVSCLKPHV